ncbi:hypothetical protein [Kribbella sp. NPDC051137]|uniref:hypothetical protein n=1 Tax=Kribbella sp. NPDC051137 TaxID=3155045 RepID=UPI003432993D
MEQTASPPRLTRPAARLPRLGSTEHTMQTTRSAATRRLVRAVRLGVTWRTVRLGVTWRMVLTERLRTLTGFRSDLGTFNRMRSARVTLTGMRLRLATVA